MTPVTLAKPLPPDVPVFNQAGEPAGNMEVPGVFNGPPHAHMVYLAVTAQRANARAGTASTKTKGEVRGGGRKPWKQKGTGRARQGSIRAPQWPGGGIVFGPRPRKYEQDLTANMRRLALRSVLAAKMQAGQVAVLEALGLEAPKTRHAAALMKKMSMSGRTLVVLPQRDEAASRAFRNLPSVRVETAGAVSVYDLLNSRHIVVVREALDALVQRCQA